VFSPNGDGSYDTWDIYGINSYEFTRVTVYNRWGNVVYTSVGSYDEPWDGMSNGNKLPTATYYYVIELGLEAEPRSGTVTIVR